VFKNLSFSLNSMSKYRFTGEIKQGRGVQGFEREIEADSLSHAKEKLFSTLCSEHSIKRTKIDIEEEEEA